MADSSAIAASIAPGVALTSAVIYWANVQSRLDTLAGRVRGLNAELRSESKGSQRAQSVEMQVQLLTQRSRVLHRGAILAVVALLGFLGASAVTFVSAGRLTFGERVATTLFMLGLTAFGASLLSMLWEMLWARRTLEEDVRSSRL